MGWRGYPDHDRRTVLFWSQKAACTTLFTLLAQAAGDPGPLRRYKVASRDTATCLRLVQEAGYAAVILARHPERRILSAYVNQFVRRDRGPVRGVDDLGQHALALHRRICADLGRDPARNLTSFAEFVAAVAALHAGRPDPWTPLNGHWDSQVPAPLAAQGFRYDRILRVERLTRDLGALAADWGIAWDGAAHNATPWAAAPSGLWQGDTPAEVLAGAPALHPGDLVSPDLRARVRAVFAVDYAVLGYPDTPD
jgi:hypothetical protein